MSYRAGAEVRQHRRVFVFDPERSTRKDGLIPRARLVAEQMLGRPLRPEERVLHRDGVLDNDDPTNLLIFPDNEAMAAWRSNRTRKTTSWTVLVRATGMTTGAEAEEYVRSLLAAPTAAEDLLRPVRVERALPWR
jgi:hypothetical protein